MQTLKILLGVLAVLLAWTFLFRTNLILKINAWVRENVFSDRVILFSGRRVAILLLVLGAVAIFSGLEEVVEVQPIKPKIAATILDQARQNLNSGEHAHAIRRARELIRSNPKDAEAWRILALAAWASGQKELAGHAVETLLRLDPNDPIRKTSLGKWTLNRRGAP